MLVWIENSGYSLTNHRRTEMTNGPTKTAMQSASSAGNRSHTAGFQFASNWPKKINSATLVSSELITCKGVLTVFLNQSSLRRCVNRWQSWTIVSKLLLQRRNVRPLPKWLSIAFFQEVSPCRLNISFCSLQNVYLPSELPAFNNSGRFLTKTC